MSSVELDEYVTVIFGQPDLAISLTFTMQVCGIRKIGECWKLKGGCSPNGRCSRQGMTSKRIEKAT